jgi:hypothetical protein
MPPRPRYPMPDFFREALEARGLMEAYRARLPRAFRGGRLTSRMTTSAGSRAPSAPKRRRNVSTRCWMNWEKGMYI